MLDGLTVAEMDDCIEYSALTPGRLPIPFTVSITSLTVVFSKTSPLGLEIKSIPMKYDLGPRIPYNLMVKLTPPVFEMLKLRCRVTLAQIGRPIIMQAYSKILCPHLQRQAILAHMQSNLLV
jgi:hypothetical protein